MDVMTKGIAKKCLTKQIFINTANAFQGTVSECIDMLSKMKCVYRDADGDYIHLWSDRDLRAAMDGIMKVDGSVEPLVLRFKERVVAG
jgi:hypothetical protein